MENIIKSKLGAFVLIAIFIIGIAPNCLAAEKTEKQLKEKWEREYISRLNKKSSDLDEKKIILKDAITKALDDEAPPCACMRIAIGLEYKPYFVIRYIYEHSPGVGLDELCWCATSDGIEKQIIAKAAADAETKDGNSVFRENEIASADCLKGDKGLAYTATPDAPGSINPPDIKPPHPTSPITP